MSTIRKLCTKCAVLSHGKLVYFGDVEKAIEIYSNTANVMRLKNDLRGIERKDSFTNYKVLIQEVEILRRESNVIEFGESLKFSLLIIAREKTSPVKLRCVVYNSSRNPIATSMSQELSVLELNVETKVTFSLDTKCLAPGKYRMKFELTHPDGYGSEEKFDFVSEAFYFEVIASSDVLSNLNWYPQYWGNIILPELEII